MFNIDMRCYVYEKHRLSIASQQCSLQQPLFPSAFLHHLHRECHFNFGFNDMTARQVRSIFLSDIHLGTKACQAQQLLEFLKEYTSEYTFLLGDIVDLWSMKRGEVHWSPAQNTFVQKMLRRSRHGEKVIFIPGNHDEAIRDYVGSSFGDVIVQHEYIHTAADGRRYLLIHGDEFDQVTLHHKWVAIMGDMAYDVLVNLNVYLSWLRRKLKIRGYWSLAGYAKRKIKTAVNFIFDFEDSVIRHARERDLDGAICGHIHWPIIKELDGMIYINCGDWVDSCTAIVEHLDGRMELIHWKGSTLTTNETITGQISQTLDSPVEKSNEEVMALHSWAFSTDNQPK